MDEAATLCCPLTMTRTFALGCLQREAAAGATVEEVDAMAWIFTLSCELSYSSRWDPVAGLGWRNRHYPPETRLFWDESVGRMRSQGVGGAWAGRHRHTCPNFTSTVRHGQEILFRRRRPDRPTTARPRQDKTTLLGML